MRILIDADGCPVTKIAIKAAKQFNIEPIIFCDTSHIFNYNDVKVITVGKGADSADFALVNQIEEKDIVVTQDYGLAAMALSKKSMPITQNGMVITNGNIDFLLATRYSAKKARMAGKHLKGPSKRTQKQNEDFEKALIALIKSTLDI